MKRVLFVLTLLFVLGAAAAFHAAAQATPQAPPSPAAAPRPPDPLEEFVPRQKLGAESVVSLPVDI